MSKLIQMNSKDDFILDYARKVIFNQSEEVILMERFLKSVPNIQTEKSCNCGNTFISAKIEKLYPGIFSNIKCDDSHFEDIGNEPLQLRMESKYETIGNVNNKNHDLIIEIYSEQRVKPGKTQELRELLECDIVLRKDGLLLFCEKIQEAEVIS